MRHAAPVVLALSLTFAVVPALADWERGKIAYRQGDWATAAAELEEVVETHPDFADGYWLLGNALARLERWEEAVGRYRQALSLEGEPGADKLLALARAEIAAVRPEAAFGTLDRVALDGLTPELRGVYFTLLAGAALRSTPDLAVERLERAVERRPGEATLWRALGQAQERAGHTGDAVTTYERAWRLQPGDAALAETVVHAAFRAAREAGETETETRLGWYRRAAAAAEALSAAEASYEHWLLLGEARLGAKEYREAATAFEKAAAREPLDPLPDYYRGRAHLGLGEVRKALWDLQEGLRKLPAEDLERRLQEALGETYHAAEEYHLAARAYRAAGRPERAELMEEYARLALINIEIDRSRRRCRERLARLEELARGAEELRGTPEWKRLERDIEALREQCGEGGA